MDDNNCTYYYEDYKPQDSDECKALYKKFKNLTKLINIYDFYRPCYQVKKSSEAYGRVQIGQEAKVYRRHYTTKDYTPWFYEREE